MNNILLRKNNNRRNIKSKNSKADNKIILDKSNHKNNKIYILSVEHNFLLIDSKIKFFKKMFKKVYGITVKTNKVKIKIFLKHKSNSYELKLKYKDRSKDLSLYEFKNININNHHYCISDIASIDIMKKIKQNKNAKVFVYGRAGELRGMNLLNDGHYLGSKLVLISRRFYNLNVYSITIYPGMSGGGYFYNNQLIGIVMAKSTKYNNISYGVSLYSIHLFLKKINSIKTK